MINKYPRIVEDRDHEWTYSPARAVNNPGAVAFMFSRAG
jgi:hypothetical protein